MPETITVNNCKIGRGEQKEVQLNIARLPTYTSIDLPVHVMRGEKEGPVLLLTGGLHGDEINGIEIIRRMIQEKLLLPASGTVIAIPLVNVYGFIQNVRGVPDGKDINRSFPGSKAGSLARLLAHTLMSQIVPQIDYGIDLHTGSASRANYPQIRCVLDIEENSELAEAFAPPVILNSSLINKSFRKAAHKKGKQILVYETGESHRLDEEGIREGMAGIQRLMKYLGMRPDAPDANHPTEIYRDSSWIRAKSAGLFRPAVTLGDHVSNKELLGHINDPYGNQSTKTVSFCEGRVIGINFAPVIHKGDALMHIAHHT